jgi:hypothetical protein
LLETFPAWKTILHQIWPEKNLIGRGLHCFLSSKS